MSVVHFVDSLHPDTGGPAKSIIRLIFGLSDIDIKSMVCAKHILPSDADSIQRARSVPVCVSNDFQFLCTAIKYLRAEKITAAHFHGVWQLKWLILIPLCLLHNVRCVVSPRGMFEHWPMQHSKRLLKRMIVNIFYRKLGNKIVYHCTSVQEYQNTLKLLGPDTMIVQLPNFIRKRDLDIELKLQIYSPNKFLCASRIHHKKGILEFIRAVANSNKIFEQIQICLAGPIEDKDLFEKIMSLKTERVHIEYLGVLDELTLRKEILNSSYVILTSFSENFGNIILESLSNYTPVIVSRSTPWIDCEDANYGYLLDPQDAKADANNALCTSSDKLAYRNIALNAGLKADGFTSDKYVKELNDLYGIQ